MAWKENEGTVENCDDEFAQIPSPTLGRAENQLTLSRFKVAILTGGQGRHYASGLAMALVSNSVRLEVLGSDVEGGPEMHRTPRLRFINLYGSKRRQKGLAAA
jgi:hypothetical protein